MSTRSKRAAHWLPPPTGGTFERKPLETVHVAVEGAGHFSRQAPPPAWLRDQIPISAGGRTLRYERNGLPWAKTSQKNSTDLGLFEMPAQFALRGRSLNAP